MAILETDILIEPDLQIANGDFNIGDANNENIKYLCIANPGQFLLSPTVGASLYRAQNASTNDARVLTASIRDQLRSDGYDEARITGEANTKTSEGQLRITATRVKKPKRQTI